jgi:hypothetical protein
MRKLVEFQPSTNNTALLTRGKPSVYEDLVLKEEYRNYRHRFEPGKTKIRLLPTIAPNEEGQWVLKVPVLQHPTGRHAHPRTIASGESTKSVFDQAYEYMKGKYPNRLFSKNNKSGIRLLPSPAVVCWAVIQDANGTKLRLLVSSNYDGSRGGAAGLGHIVQEFVNRHGSDETVPGHPLNETDGVSLIIERIGGADTKFPSYRLSVADDRGPLKPILDRLTDVEYNMLCPLAETIHIVEPEAEWQLLRKVIGDEFYAEIRSAQEKSKVTETRGQSIEESTPGDEPPVCETPSADEAAYHPDDYKDFPSKFNI